MAVKKMNSVFGHVDFEVYVGHLGRNVKEAVGYNGLNSERGSGVDIKIWESPRVKGLIIRNIVGLYFPTLFDVWHGQ